MANDHGGEAPRESVDPGLRPHANAHGTARRGLPSAHHAATARRRTRAQRVPADLLLRLPVGLRDDRAGGAERQRRVAVPAADGLAERVRGDPRPRRGHVPARPGRRRGARRPPLPARHARAGDELGRAGRLDHRARRAADGPVAPRGGPLQDAPPRADRLRRRARAAAHGPLRGRRGPGLDGLRARVRLRARARPAGSTPATATTRRPAARRDGQTDAEADHRPQPRPRGPARHRAAPDEGGRAAVRARCPGASTRRRRPTTRPTGGSCGPRTTGSTGSPAARSPTTRGAASSSAAR